MKPFGSLTLALLCLAGPLALAAESGAKLPPAVEQAIETRQAVFHLIGYNFKPLGEVLKGGAYDAADSQRRLARLVSLSDHLDEIFPDISNVGDPATKAKPEIWTNKADVAKRGKDFQAHIAALQQVNATDKAATDGVKAAILAVAQDCKGCHENYRAK
jgi:cytochrome c556